MSNAILEQIPEECREAEDIRSVVLGYDYVKGVVEEDLDEVQEASNYPVLTMRDLRQLFDLYTNNVLCQYENGNIEDKCNFVVGILNMHKVKMAIDIAIENRSKAFYDFADSFCKYLKTIAKFEVNDFSDIVKQYIKQGGNISSAEYRNLNLVMNAVSHPKLLCYYIEANASIEKPFILYNGRKWVKYMNQNNSYMDVYTYRLKNSTKQKFLHRVLWEEFNGEIPKDHYVIFKDKNKNNLSLSNMELVDKHVYRSIHSKEVTSQTKEVSYGEQQ